MKRKGLVLEALASNVGVAGMGAPALSLRSYYLWDLRGDSERICSNILSTELLPATHVNISVLRTQHFTTYADNGINQYGERSRAQHRLDLEEKLTI
ncbi:hypothetical protein FKM82_016364 [Ascaphus truei]